MDPLRLATVWLGGCSGCHMSFLDLDEWLIDLLGQVQLVYSPIMDIKVYPEAVDLCLVEGAVANRDHLEMIHLVRQRSKVLVAFGDCAITGNVTALRNPLGSAQPVLTRAYVDRADLRPQIPAADLLPVLLDRVHPVHEIVPVDHYLPGCPPPADHIRAVLEDLLAGRTPQRTPHQLKFG